MAFRKVGKLIRFTTKTGLAGGTMYIYYETGLWKNSDETIKNYDKFKKDVQTLYDASPEDVKKWAEYGSSTVNLNTEPVVKAVSDFRKEWLNFDFSWLTEPGDGIVKPAWNKGVTFTVDTVVNAPQSVKKWASIAYEKVTELAAEKPAVKPSSSEDSGLKQ